MEEIKKSFKKLLVANTCKITEEKDKELKKEEILMEKQEEIKKLKEMLKEKDEKLKKKEQEIEYYKKGQK